MSSSGKFDSLIGQVIDKRYKVLSAIGEGGMSIVFKAHDMITDRNVAIKVLNESNDTDGQAVKRFLNESKAISMLSHENIVKIYDVSFEKELKYIVMEHVAGDTLKGYMDKRGKKLSLEEALGFTEQILLALEHAHSKKVIHRDIKPHNIMVLDNGFIKVTDFGIAKTPSGDTISMTDKALGTVYYVSPEQASGKETGTFTDIYSVGVMLYEMATGKLPFNADTPVSVAMKQINDDPEPPCSVCPELPRGIEQIILKAMQKNPEDRFKSAHSMLRAVRILKENPMVVFEEVKAPQGGTAGKPSPRKKSLKNGFFGKVIGLFSRDTKKGDVKNEKASESGGSTRVTMFPVILGIACAFFITIFVVGAIMIAGIFKNQSDVSKKTFTREIPELAGQEYDEELLKSLEKDGYEVEVKWAEKRNTDYGYGEIYNTNPEGGQARKVVGSQKIKLILYVNPEEGSFALADYSIQYITKVRTDLRNKGYDPKNIVEITEPHETVLEGYVIKTEPAGGQVASADDTITIYVSSGKKLKGVLSMPDLVGKTKGEAAVTLEKFTVEYLTVADPSSIGTVVWQSVEPHTVISPEFCDKITLFVSDGTLTEGDTNPLYLIMPGLIGKSLPEAEKLMREIQSYGIKVEYIKTWESLPEGTVFDQTVEEGATILLDSVKPIKIFYSDGNKPAQNTTPDEEGEQAIEDAEEISFSDITATR